MSSRNLNSTTTIKKKKLSLRFVHLTRQIKMTIISSFFSDISNQDCDFEGGFCSWMNLGGSYDGYGLWTRGGGATKTTLPKPSKDHTLGTSTGKNGHDLNFFFCFVFSNYRRYDYLSIVILLYLSLFFYSPRGNLFEPIK